MDNEPSRNTNESGIKTWRERIGVDAGYTLHAATDVERAMESEIAELRLLATQAQAAAPATDLHNAIMNIPCKRADREFMNAEHRMLYKNGHRDARHAAAELALAHPAAAVEPTSQAQMLAGALKHAREALRFYAEQGHFTVHQPDEWDTVSSEPHNFYEDSNNTATVEDGSVAQQALDDIAHVERYASVVAAVEPVAIPAGWISVGDALPEKYCLAIYENSRGRQHIIRAMHVRQYQIEASGDDCDTEINDENDTEYLKSGWYELIDNWGEYSSVAVCEGVVTHWMPLPALPGAASPASPVVVSNQGEQA